MDLMFDSAGIIRDVIPANNRSITHLKNASSCFITYEQNNIPFDSTTTTSLLTELNSMSAKIRAITTKVDKLDEFLNNSINGFSDVEANNAYLANQLASSLSPFMSGQASPWSKPKWEWKNDYEQNPLGAKYSESARFNNILDLYNGILSNYTSKLAEQAEECRRINELLGGILNGYDDIFGFLFTDTIPSSADIAEAIKQIDAACMNLDSLIDEQLRRIEQAENEGYSDKRIKQAYEQLDLLKQLKEQYKLLYPLLTEYSNNMSEIRNSIYSVERAMEVYPYDKIAEKEDFKEYLERDYSAELSMLQGYSSMYGGKYDEAYNLLYLNQKELATYYYLKEKQSADAADEYLGKLKDLVNQRKGLEQANAYIDAIIRNNGGLLDILNDFGITTGTGLKDGVISFLAGLQDIFLHDGIISDLEYKQMYINYLLSREYSPDVNSLSEEELEQYRRLAKLSDEYKALLGTSYQVSVGIGNMAIPMISGAAVTLATGGAAAPELFLGMTAGEITSLTLMGLSATGRGVEEAYQNGVTGLQAYLYGIASGLSEVAIEQLLDGIPGLSNAGELKKGFKNFLISFSKSVVSEGLEEFIQTYLSYGLKDVFELPVDWDNIHSEAFNSAKMGMLTAAVMNGGSLAVQTAAGKIIQITLTGKEINPDGSINMDAVDKLLVETNSNSSSPGSKKNSDIFQFEFNQQDPLAGFFNDFNDGTIISNQNAQNIMDMINDTNYVYGIHFSGLANPDSIMQNGLWLTGHSSSGVSSDVDLSYNILFPPSSTIDDQLSLYHFLVRLSSAAGYKTGGADAGNAMIVRIPKSEFDNLGNLIDYNSSQPTLKPEYMAGYIPVQYDANIGKTIISDMIQQGSILSNSVEGKVDTTVQSQVLNTNNQPIKSALISEKLTKSANAIKEFLSIKYGKRAQQYIDIIDNNINNNIVLYESLEELQQVWRKIEKKDEYTRAPDAFVDITTGFIHMTEDVSPLVFIHETLHQLGSISGDNSISRYIQINEALTDYLVKQITGKTPPGSAYGVNTTELSDIIKRLESLGYGEVIYEAFFEKKPQSLSSLIDSFTYIGFFDELAYCMTSVFNSQGTKTEVAKLQTFTDYFLLVTSNDK